MDGLSTDKHGQRPAKFGFGEKGVLTLYRK